MLPPLHQIAFLIFALIVGGIGVYGFYRLYLRIMRGAPASEARTDHLPGRIGYALVTALTQERTFRRRTGISILHSFIFYGFTYYLLVNVIDGLEGYFHFSILSSHPLGAVYNFLADLMSFLVYVGVVGLLIRRLWTPSKRDFRFTEKTLLHPLVRQNYIKRDSLIVSVFILFHIGSRFVGNAAKMVAEAREFGHYDALQPFASGVGSLLFGGLSDSAIQGLRLAGFWGGLGSIIAFLAYFPFSKHIHIFMAPLNYALKRPVGSGVLPPMKGLEEAMESEDPKLGVEKLEELEWPRLLDAYACIQCNRCQDVCPANATGKALSPAALEINKRMELNVIASGHSPFTLKPVPFEAGASTAHPLLEFAINEESVWACTTCGACMQVCPVQDEQMLDIVDIRRHQVMVAGEFPQQLQTAFRGMERASNPWGISRDKRMEWAEGLKVPTIDENPEPDVLYWVGCAASYDPGAQKVARSFVQLLDKAGVNYAVLGKKEACTGDSARRAGNEFLYQQLAQENVETLNTVAPKLIVATCPHCMNAIGNEYRQIGGDYRTIHHTEYLETLVAAGKLPLANLGDHVTYHDPCYLGRHNGVYDAPRTLITRMAGEILDLERQRENSFCCGAGGAQFWKEEEEGRERVSDNRFREIQARLDSAAERSADYEKNGASEKVLAVGCPFCKAMMNSTPEKQKRDDIIVKDVAELMLESVMRATGEEVLPTGPEPVSPIHQPEYASAPNAQMPMHVTGTHAGTGAPDTVVGQTNADFINQQPGSPAGSGTQHEAQAEHPEQVTQRRAWKPKGGDDVVTPPPAPATDGESPTRKAWQSRGADEVSATPTPVTPAAAAPQPPAPEAAPARKAWKPKGADDVSAAVVSPETAPAAAPSADTSTRKAWAPKAKSDDVNAAPVTEVDATPAAPATGEAAARQAWKPKAKAEDATAAQPTLVVTTPAAPTAASTAESITEATGERKKWTPKAPATDATAPASAAPVVTAPAEPANVTPATAPAGERPKWQPKKTATATAPVQAAPAPANADPAPITEHVYLEQAGENALEQGATATADPAAPPAQSPTNPDTGRRKWTPKKPS
ncbi:4Fe-4S dicluster domain-containing protein [Deinococcus cavernae]|uniref:4Fe-4S dicluster domain-containing protein n=2 Tax=Deinococcus cavernae TaxID=2320857 RepID=A0A418VCH8_9DEIO|nr:(Fe-S)-binding protein [Deinococcus cavernae]RJF73827.1 4Fe-4S dicluster domain-containing protein [Deinococcus cavernae]